MPELLELATPNWQLKVVGPLPVLPPFVPVSPNTSIQVLGSACRPVLRVYQRATHDLVEVFPGEPVEPIFFENQAYNVYLSAPDRVARLRLPPAAQIYRFKGIEHGTINFRNEVGFAELEIQSTKEDSVVLRLEVFPVKLDYRHDYELMRAEIADEVRNLALSVLTRVFNFSSPVAARPATINEWWSIIHHYFSKFVAAANAIALDPHSRLVASTESVSVHKSRKADERGLDRMLRRSGTSLVGVFPSGIPAPNRVPEKTHRVTFDTPENRYIKALLIETARKIRRLISLQDTGDEDADLSAEQKFFRGVRPEAIEMLRQVERLLRVPFLQEVETTPPVPPASMVFYRHPHYAAFAKIARFLNGGLSLDEGNELVRVGVKDIALLYQYWCFIRLLKILRERFTLVQLSQLRVAHLKATVALTKGAPVRFRDPATGKIIELIYDRQFSDLPTIAQRPDNVIQLASEDRLYIFDAKYRLDFDEDYQNRYGGIGPKAEDINTMHRYRDAIVVRRRARKGDFVSIIKGAIVLFPYLGEAVYQEHKFFRSIDQVEIGGLPFLPGATTLVENKVAAILAQEGFDTISG